MKLPRRQFLHLAAGAAALPVVSRFAWAQAYPSRPVKIIVSFAAGGPTDILARLTAQWLSERLGQQFVVENRPGGGGNIGTEAVVRASPDGYTLLMAGGNNAINATLYDKLNFNFIRDIAPVATIIRAPQILVVNPSVPAKSVPEFIAYAKANPGKITMASTGIGSGTHITGELFKMMAGVDMVHVPYRSGGPALTDLIAGQVQVMFPTTVSSIGYIRAGRLRALAVTTATRSLRGERLVRRGRTQEHAHRRCRQAQQRNQRRPCRSQDQGAACRPGRHAVSKLAFRIRKVHCRRHGKVGQGGPGGRHQGE
jgi:tripartite-type tricarboxylate transporter receptor subunit TctC